MTAITPKRLPKIVKSDKIYPGYFWLHEQDIVAYVHYDYKNNNSLSMEDIDRMSNVQYEELSRFRRTFENRNVQELFKCMIVYDKNGVLKLIRISEKDILYVM